MPDGSIVSTLSTLALTSVAVVPPDHPDAELIRLCAEWHQLGREWDAINMANGDFGITPEMNELMARQNTLTEPLVQVGCHTLEGLRALAGVLHDAEGTIDYPTDGPHERLPALIIRSLLRGVDLAATTALTPPGSDATLLAACAAFDVAERQFLAVFDQPDRTEADEQVASDTATEAQWPLLREIEANPPTTLPGFIAVARSLATWDQELLKPRAATSTTGPVLTAILAKALLAAETSSPDADLIAAAQEFCRQADRYEACNFGATPGTLEAVRASAEQEMELGRMYDIAKRMAGMPCTTPAGLAARAMVIGRNDPTFDFGYDNDDDSLGKIMLTPLLRDGHALAMGAVQPGPDDALVVLIPEFRRLLAAVKTANECPAADCDDPVFGEFDEFCLGVTEMPPAITADGRAFQAAAALHQLTYVCGPEELNGGGAAAWRVLAGIVGDAYPMPRLGVEPEPPEVAAEADAPLFALKVKYDAVQAEIQASLEKDPSRNIKKATHRKFEDLVAQVVRMPKARTVAGLEFQGQAEWLAQARGVDASQEAGA